MKANKYYPFAFIYFFVNALGLPYGLLFTMLLTPFFYIWLLLKGKKQLIVKFLIFFLPFIINHLINGVDAYNYFRSLVIFITVYIFCYAFYVFITSCHDLKGIFSKLLVTNFALTLVALLFLYTPYRNWFWSDWSISTSGIDIHDWPRLIMFTYEPSYYSTLMVPLIAFYFMKFILRQIEGNVYTTMTMVVLPLILSFSMGVLSGLILAIAMMFLINFSKFLTKKRLFYSLLTVTVVGILAIIGLYIFFPDNPFFVRVIAIFAGDDGSAKGRTYQAFQLGYMIAEQKSIWWGVGFGHLKTIGDPIIKEFYKYPADYGQVSIPCTSGETLALFGFVGLFLRLFIEIYLFFKTNVLSNTYRTLLFFYIFIYQFTGSYTTNIAEYVIWILAFTNVFPQFDRSNIQGKILTQ